MRRLLPSLGWLLLGLLAISGAMISAGRNSYTAFPAADSYAPSGTSALFSLLRAKGYDVDVDRDTKPRVSPGEVAIAFTLDDSDDGGAPETDASKSLEDSVRNGGVVFQLPLSKDYQGASLNASTPTSFKRPDGQNRSINAAQSPFSQSAGAIPLLSSGINWFSSATKQGLGYEVSYTDGIGLTNRFIDQAQNAQSFLEALHAFAPPHAKVLFTEATFGNGNDPGLLRTIGAWAEGAWYQLIFLFVVIIYSLNKRFGLPEEYRPKQKGARELLDAITDVYTRSKASGPALEAAGERTNATLRSVLRLPRDASEGELLRLLPPALANTMAEVTAASQMRKPPQKEALELVKKLEAQTEAFLADKRPQIARRRKAA